jgi:hypothetical protein
MHRIRRMIPSPPPAFAAFPAAGAAARHVGLVPESSIHGLQTSPGDASQRENVPKFGTRCLQSRGGGPKLPKRSAAPGLPGVFCGSQPKPPPSPIPRTPNILELPSPLRPRFTFAGTVLLASYAGAIARIRRQDST